MKITILTPKVDEKVMKSLTEATINKTLYLTEEGVGVVMALNINNDIQK